MVIDPLEIKTRKKRYSVKILRKYLKTIFVFFVRSFVALFFFTIIHQFYLKFYISLYYNELKLDLHLKPINPDIKYTVFMLVKNRYQYQKTMWSFVDKLGDDSEFHLNDLGSHEPLPLPPEYEDHPQVKVFRMADAEDDPFLFWRSLTFAINNIESEYVFYFDNCNSLPSPFDYESYVEKGHGFFFPNMERQHFAGNFFVKRDRLFDFLEESPIHLIHYRRSLNGADQTMIWYLDLYRGMMINHEHHDESEAVLGHYQYFHLKIMRIFLYLNYYGKRIENGIGSLNSKWCFDKKILCWNGGILRKFLRLPGIYHVTDTLMSSYVFWMPLFFFANHFRTWLVGGFFSVLLSLLILGSVGWTLEKAFFHIKKRMSK